MRETLELLGTPPLACEKKLWHACSNSIRTFGVSSPAVTTEGVRGRSTSSDVSSDISPSPLYIPPHRRQPKTECTRGSDTGV